MTSRERVMRTLKGETPDRVPVFVMSRAFSIRQRRTSFGACLRDETGEIYAQAQYETWKRFGHDGVMDLEGVNSESEALGCRLKMVEQESPVIAQPVLESWSDLDRFRQRALDLETTWPISRQLNVVRKLKAKVGDDTAIYANPQCPLRSAAMLRGLERALMDTIDYPEQLHRLLEYTTQVAIQYGAALVKAGSDVLMASNPLGSRSVISRHHYEEFSFPYDREMVKAFHKEGILVILHICGDVKDRLDLIVDSGYDGVSLDSQVDLVWAKKEFGNRICLIGNVDVLSPLLAGTPEEVRNESIRCLEILGSSGGMLAAGCEVAPHTPPANLEALIQATQVR